MVTIEELRREVQKEKNFAEAKRDIEGVQTEKTKLKKELFKLRFKRQNPKLVRTGQILSQIGKKGFNTLDKLGANLEEADRKRKEALKKSLKKKKKGIRKASADVGLFGRSF